MKVWGSWFGGSSYAVPYLGEEEEFSSMAEAVREFRWRRFGGSYRFPCVDNTSTMWLFFRKPDGRDCPDRVLSIGPRGGVRVER